MLSNAPVPLYFQVATELEARIAAGEFAIGAFLPSEHELARQFQVSLITVRGAMRVLADQRLIERQPGKGTVVIRAAPSVVWELGWLNDIVTSVMPSKLEIVKMGRVKAPAWVASRLGLSAGAKTCSMTTVRRAMHKAGEVFMTSELFHPDDIGSAISRSDFDGSNAKLVVLTVERKCGLQVTNVRQTMTAEIADGATARLLQVKKGMPLLVVTRDYFDANQRLIQTGRTLYRTDDYQYVLNLARSGARPSRMPFEQRKTDKST